MLCCHSIEIISTFTSFFLTTCCWCPLYQLLLASSSTDCDLCQIKGNISLYNPILIFPDTHRTCFCPLDVLSEISPFLTWLLLVVCHLLAHLLFIYPLVPISWVVFQTHVADCLLCLRGVCGGVKQGCVWGQLVSIHKWMIRSTKKTGKGERKKTIT